MRSDKLSFTLLIFHTLIWALHPSESVVGHLSLIFVLGCEHCFMSLLLFSLTLTCVGLAFGMDCGSFRYCLSWSLDSGTYFRFRFVFVDGVGSLDSHWLSGECLALWEILYVWEWLLSRGMSAFPGNACFPW